MDNFDENKTNSIETGKRIAFIRECMKMSQPKFAELVNISQNFLSQIENGNRGVSGETVARISNATGYSTDYILLGKTGNDIISPDSRAIIREHLTETLRILDEK